MSSATNFDRPAWRRHLARVVGVVLLLTAVVPAVSADEPSLYIVGPNDLLSVTVYNQPQLSGKYMVQPDGTFTFPLLGRLKVGGLSVQAIENDVRDRLANGYLKNPQVGVSVDQYRSQQVFVMGEVRQPGGFQFTGAMTVIEALARAGSTTEQAGLEALIVRQPAGAPPLDAAALERAKASTDSNVIHINLENLQNGVMSQNATLQGGDTIFVPRAELVFLSGLVNTPGAHPYRKGMTVRQALALAGGVNERGSTRRIQIVRKVDGQERTINTNLKDLVQPGDTIVVRERFF
jgi:polysaccharide export outer membrane protein